MWAPDFSCIISAEMKEEAARSERLAAYHTALNDHLYGVAKQCQYGDLLTSLGRINTERETEAQAYIQWRDAALAYASEKLEAVEAGEIDVPTVADFVSGIAPMEWPKLR